MPEDHAGTGKELKYGIFSLPVIACTLGYFIDVYDLILFNTVRVSSLKAINIPEDRQIDAGLLLINLQMAGLVLGGFLFGVLGDKFGRTRVLFVSIAIYSLATLVNAFVTSLPAYAVLRFIAGLGLAGELGLAVTLVSELSERMKRGYAVSLLAGFGVAGAVGAGISAQYFDWKTCYLLGGGLGLILLILRASVLESLLFRRLHHQNIRRGSLRQLFSTRDSVKRFALCILIGTSFPFIFWMLIAFAPEFTQKLGLSRSFPVSEAVIFGYSGFAVGDLITVLLSEIIGSRRRVLIFFQALSLVLCLYFIGTTHADNINLFRGFYAALGFSAGCWGLMVLIAAESFGTNLRATVATTVPNLARAASVPMGLALSMIKPHLGLIDSAIAICIVAFALTIGSAFMIRETYGRDLDYLEKQPI